MKKLRLNPLGELSHRLSMGWLMMGLMATLCLGACSDDDDDNVAAAFPAKQTFNCDANETKELTFPTNASWTLTSSELWCRFVVDGVEEYSLSGGAGQQKVTLKITDEAQKTDAKSVANITLAFGSESAIVAEVVRNAKGFEFAITDEEGNPVDVNEGALEVGYDNFINYNVKANFRFAATNRPDWIQIKGNAIVGTPNVAVACGLKVIEDGSIEKHEITAEDGYTITFADENGLYSKDVKLTFKGMDRDEISFEGPSWFNWEVSLDGKTFTQTSTQGVDGTTTNLTYNKFIPFTVKAFNDDYVPVYIQVVEEWGMVRLAVNSPEEPVDWIHLEDKEHNGNARLTIDESYDGSEREGYVLVLPRSEYDRITADGIDGFYGEVITFDENYNQTIGYKYEQSNLLIHFVQKEKKAEQGGDDNGIKITSQYWENWGAEVKCVEVTGDEADFYKSEYGASKVYSVSASDCASILVQVPFEISTFYAELDGEDVTNDYCAPDDYGDATKMCVWGCSGISSEMVVAIRDAFWTQVTVLLIRP